MNPGRLIRSLMLVAALCSLVIAACAVSAAAETVEPIASLGAGGGAFRCVFSPNGETLALACMDGTIRVFDTGTWGLMWETRLHDAQPANCVAFSPDGRSIAACVKGEKAVLFLDPRTGRETRSLMIPGNWEWPSGNSGSGFRMWEFAFSPNGRTLACADGFEGGVILVDVSTGRFLAAPITHLSGMGEIYVVFSPDGRLLASAGSDDRIIVWDMENDEEVAALRTVGIGDLDSIAFSPDGRLLAAGGEGSTAVLVWDTATWGETRLSANSKGAAGAVTFSPDGRFLVCGYKDLRIWSLETLDLISTSAVCPKGATWLRFSPDSSLIILSENIARIGAQPSPSVEVWLTSALLGEE